METLSKGPRTGVGKFLEYLPIILIAAIAFYFWGSISGFVRRTVKDTADILWYGIPTAFVLLFLWHKWAFVKMSYHALFGKIEKLFIKMDPLSYMDRYADLLDKKRQNLDLSIQRLQGKKAQMQRRITGLEENIRMNLKKGTAAKNDGQEKLAILCGTKVAGDKESIRLFTPLYTRIDKNLKMMTDLSENWKFSGETLRYEIERKRTEYEVIKEIVGGLRNAEDMINSNSEEARIYGLSLQALEEKASQGLGYIEDFDRRSKDVIDGISLDKQMLKDEGLKALEEYMQNGTLVMPDFTNFELTNNPAAQVSPVTVQAAPKFNILNKNNNQ